MQSEWVGRRWRAFVRVVPHAAVLFALFAVGGCGISRIARPVLTPTPTIRPEELWGYIPYYDLAAAWSSAEANRPRLTGVALVMYYLAADGGLIAYPEAETIPAWANEQRLAIVPVIANSQQSGWDRDIVAGIIGDPERRRQHIERIIAMVEAAGYPGVEIDYESLTAADRETFSLFIEELAAALHARGKTLSVAVHAKVAEPGEWGGPQAQDWSRLGAAADRIVILAYDYDPTHPGPISPLPWTRQVLQHAVSLIAPRKVIQGLPLYGYDWAGAARGREGSFQTLQDRASQQGVTPQRDPASHHLSFEYRADGVAHEVWLVDAETLTALTQIGRENPVGGYALWRLGGEDVASWPILEGALR